jgi:hypothetical protein
MIYLKSIAAGLAGAVAGAVLMLVLELVAFALLMAVGRSAGATGSGGIGAVSVLGPTIPMLVFAVAGFVAGFWLVFRKRSATAR